MRYVTLLHLHPNGGWLTVERLRSTNDSAVLVGPVYGNLNCFVSCCAMLNSYPMSMRMTTTTTTTMTMAASEQPQQEEDRKSKRISPFAFLPYSGKMCVGFEKRMRMRVVDRYIHRATRIGIGLSVACGVSYSLCHMRRLGGLVRSPVGASAKVINNDLGAFGSGSGCR